jgi:activating signal cointegrator complex subunit 3
MASMNKPVYTFIQNFSENKPVLIFVSSRRQTRLTALDLIALRMIDTNAKDETSALHQNDEFLQLLSTVTDTTLQYTLQFGIALHHAGESFS